VDLAAVTLVAPAAVVTLVVGDMAALAATAKFSQAFVKSLSRDELSPQTAKSPPWQPMLWPMPKAGGLLQEHRT
jgi:hypothetical protein